MSTKYPSPLLGYNNNVRHKGKVFHIQTEDSGVKYGHIITHLFMDGGRILKSVKTSYAEYVGTDRMSEVVREMMKQQHKAMFIALRDGKFDTIIDGNADPSQSTQMLSPSMAPPAPPAQLAPTASTSNLSFVPQPSVPVGAPVGVPAGEVRKASIAAVQAAGAAAGAPKRPASGELKLDLEALERAAAGSAAPSPVLRGSELPPPPANLFRDKATTGKYRVTPPPPADVAASPAGGARHASPMPPAGKPGRAEAPAASAERRYAPTRPASIFGQAKPQQGKSIFGEDLISDKSLDEVILSYLAEDLETDAKKRK
jgi:hypothetical protein